MRKTKYNISSYDLHLFHEGSHFRAYEFLGSRVVKKKNVKGVQFALWAPKAKDVRVVGDFNNWCGTNSKMKKHKGSDVWILFIPGLDEGCVYKYEIVGQNNKTFLKADPYAYYSEKRPNTASIVTKLSGYKWRDSSYLNYRKHINTIEAPLNIYEVHLGSWKLKDDYISKEALKNNEELSSKKDDSEKFLNFREIAERLVPYVKEMGYTHIELLPVSEHPLDMSWGYQCTGYYSVTSRFGTPNDFKYFVDKCHQNNIGVILDWVPGHFCKDAHGLYEFDGSHLYEYEDPIKRENYDWGTANFDFTKGEVQSFLISNGVFFFENYHIDGIRVDAVANLLYLTYGKKENLNIKNKFGGNENLEAIDFIKKFTKVVHEYFPHAILLAEESTTWPLVTKETYLGGLGFNYKWNMGWMNDMLKYMELDPIHRKWHHNLITFSLMYAFSENFILPLSHDEVVHGKKSLINKMPGSYYEKFASLRLFYGYMMAHPGKKLSFMGNEFGQFIEWNFNDELDFNLLEYESHKNIKSFNMDLNNFYKNEKAFWELDCSSKGFRWIDHENSTQSIISFIRYSKDKNDFIIVVCNFTPVYYENFRLGIPRIAQYTEVFNSDASIYGGKDRLNKEIISPIFEPYNNEKFSIDIKVPPLSTLYLKPKFKERKPIEDDFI